jgi:DNA-binding Xre family transcriptional regulator
MRPSTYAEVLSEEELILGVSEAIVGAMKWRGVTRTSLARTLGVTEGAVAQMLDGRNLTLRTVARIVSGLECQISVSVVPQRISGRVAASPTPSRRPTKS